MPTVRIPTPLRQAARGNAEVKVAGDTVDDVIADLERQFPGLKERLVDDGGELRRFINIRRADVKEDYGWVALELEAKDEKTLEKGVAWLKATGVDVDPIERDVVVP